ncbi:MAG: DUF6337 family protein [Bacteroides sp.]|nr:DUF6337 family protein [Bacteroides sp.]
MLWLILLLAECALLSCLDKRLWKTYFTPLHFLMVPYLLVLLFTLCVAGRFGLEKFYYPSLLPWMIGLPLFAAGGVLIHLANRAAGKKTCGARVAETVETETTGGGKTSRAVLRLSAFFLCLLGGWFIYLAFFRVDATCLPGTECFGRLLVGRKVFSHSSVILTALLVMNIFLFDGKAEKGIKVAQGCVILLSCACLFFQQVQSWILLPVLAGIFARAVAGKTHFNLKLFLGVTAGGSVIFFLGYLISPGHTFTETSRLFIHYLTSGTLGLSMDMQQGILENREAAYLFTPFLNMWNFVSGNELLSHQNPIYLNTGLRYTNVRTFFGTLYVFSPPILFGLFSAGMGALSYGLFVLWRRRTDILNTCLYGWLCTVLFIGWFNLYTPVYGIWAISFWIVATGMVFRRWLQGHKPRGEERKC